jgi:GT2 family glycosyltransferase
MGKLEERAPRPVPVTGRQVAISVVIVSFNSAEFIGSCLESIRRSACERSAVDVVVVDNASSDESVAAVEGFDGVALRMIANKENLGFAKAANMGIRASGGSYVLLLNPDTVLPPTAIDTLVDFMETHPDAGIVSPRLAMRDGKIDPGCHRGMPSPWASFTYLVGLEKLFPRTRLFNGYHRWDLPLDRVHPVDAVSGAFMLMRRSVLCDVGLLDERFFMYAEDVDMCARAREAGYRVYFHPGETVLHVKGTSSGIKRHSEMISRAGLETRQRALNAFYDSTKAFYDKYYAARYPRPLKWAVHLTVEATRPVANWRLRRRFASVTPQG